MNLLKRVTTQDGGQTRNTLVLLDRLNVYSYATPTQQKVRGVSGQDISRGVFHEDFNKSLQHPEGAATFDRMRRTDSQVRKQLRGMTYPILAAEWFIGAPEGEEENAEVAEAIEFLDCAVLGKGSTPSWCPSFTFRQHQREALSMLVFGFSTFECVWKGVDGKMIIDRLLYRSQRSLERFELGENGEVLGLWQVRSFSSDDDRPGEKNSSQKRKGFQGNDIYLPMNALVHYTFEQEGVNIWGESLLRSMYGSWKFKEMLNRYDVIDSQRRAAGMPVGHLSETDSSQERDDLINIVKNMDGSNPESRYAVLTADQTLGFVNNESKSKDVGPAITRFDRGIADGASGRFMDGGEQAGGSKAVNSKLSDQFFVTLNAIAEELAEAINKQWIDRLLEINFPTLAAKPRIKFTRLALDEGLALVDALGVAKQAGLIERWGLEDENNMRSHLRLRPMSEEEAEELEEKAQEKLDKEQANAMEMAAVKGGPVGSDPGSVPARPGGGKPRASRDPRASQRGRGDRADRGRADRQKARRAADLPRYFSDHADELPEDFFDVVLMMPHKKVRLRAFEEEYGGMAKLVVTEIRADFIKRVRKNDINITNVSRVKAAHAGRLQQALKGIADRVSAFGAQMVQTELVTMKARGIKGAYALPARSPLKHYAKFYAIAQDVAAAGTSIDVGKILREEEAILMSIIEQASATASTAEELADAVIASYASRVDTYVEAIGRRGTVRSYNAGRDTVIRTTSVAETAVRNEEMDEGTCLNCAEIHGLVVAVGGDDYYTFMPPNYCQGYDRCRGEYTYFPAGEED
jgi:hypothetical protein